MRVMLLMLPELTYLERHTGNLRGTKKLVFNSILQYKYGKNAAYVPSPCEKNNVLLIYL